MAVYCPCRNCTDRVVGCHSTCALYIYFMNEKKKERDFNKEAFSRLAYEQGRLWANQTAGCGKKIFE